MYAKVVRENLTYPYFQLQKIPEDNISLQLLHLKHFLSLSN